MLIVLKAVLFIGGLTALALLVHLLVRRTVPLHVLEAHHPVAGVLLTLVGSVYGIVLAFVLVAVWQGFEDARTIVSMEASAAGNVARLARGLPAPTGPALHDATVAYLEAVIRDGWPRMAEAHRSAEVDQRIATMWRLLVTFEPRSEGTRNVHLEALDQMGDLATQRGLRLLASRYQLPHLLWVVLIIGGIATLCFVNFFGLRYPRSEALMTIVVALLLSAAIYTILALHQPFSGDVRVPPAHMEEELSLLQEGS
ncbi:MAG: DUF4239 domain-containing protein [Myxococcaceae bacterium]|nr:DUF4239 domain-containing protein [Myxococcaceae bacterium]